MINQNQSLSKRISTPIGILIIVSVAIIAAGILAWQYFGAPKEEARAPVDETANWKTYRNEIYKFEVRYPENWPTQEYSPGRQWDLPEEERSIIISFASNQEDLIRERGVNIFISPPVVTSWELAEDVICKNEEMLIENIRNLIQEKTIKDYCFTGKELYFYTASGRIFKFYKIIEEEIFNQMLSTFRFLE